MSTHSTHRDKLHEPRHLRSRYPAPEPKRQHPWPIQHTILRALYGAEYLCCRRGWRTRFHPLASILTSQLRARQHRSTSTAQNESGPWSSTRVAALSSSSNPLSSSGKKKNGVVGAREGIVGGTVLGALLVG